VTTIIITLIAFYPKKYINNISSENKIVGIVGEQFKIIEYPLIFLSIELQSYALYLICSIYRNSEQSVSAGLTYFLLGGLSSCIILLGQSLLYLNTGNTNLENIYVIKSIYDTLHFDDTNLLIDTLYNYSVY
jgi:NADH-ubiquinone oxidoreductase chain 2